MHKLIIVDDEAAVVRSLSNAIDWESYNIELAGVFTDSTEAAEKLRGGRVDILITDVCMPGCDGMELMKLARKHNPAIRVIVISAHDSFEYVKEALKNGAENYLLKPVDESELQQTIHKTLEYLQEFRTARPAGGSHMAAFKSNILDRWLCASISEEELTERAGMLGVNLEADCFTVVVFHMEPAGLPAATALMDALAAEGDPARQAHFYINSAFQVVAVLACCGDTGQTVDELRTKATALAGREGLSVFTCVGAAVEEPLLVSRSYRIARKYCFARHLGFTFLRCSDYPEGTAPGALDDMLSEIRERLKERVQEEVDRLCAAVLSEAERAADASHAQKTAFTIAASITKAVQDACQGHELPPAYYACLREYLDPSVKLRLQGWLRKLSMQAIQLLNEKQSLMHPYVLKAIEIIHNNYSQDISLKTISARFNVSPAYMGQLFKTQTNKYFNDYLAAVRLQNAKKLVGESDLKVSDIARKTGFASQTYFNRLFKRVYGTSPGEFRQAVKTRDGNKG